MDNQKYVDVAQKCPSYTRKQSGAKNTCSDSGSDVSCKLCLHFKDQHCELDLYDKIVDKYHM